MKSPDYSYLEITVLSLFAACVILFSAGFWFPDPFVADRLIPIKEIVLLWLPRIGIPLLTVFGLYLYHRIKTGKLAKQELFLSAGAFLVLLFICYPVVNIFYHQSFQLKKKGFHPHLMLQPNKLDTTTFAEPDLINVVVLGGSTTEFPNSEGIGWPKMVEEQMGKNFRFHNQGKGWYTSLHSLINYQANIRPYKPDALIIMHGINDLLSSADFSYFSKGKFQRDYGHFYGPTKRLMDHRDLTADVFSTLSKLWFHQKRKEIGDFEFKGLSAFEHNLNSIIDLAEMDGTKVILITQPTIYKPDMSPEERDVIFMLKYEALNDTMRWSLDTAIRGMEAYNNTIKKVAEERGLTLINLEEEIPRTLEYFYDDCHYNDAAFPLIAREISTKLWGIIKTGG